MSLYPQPPQSYYSQQQQQQQQQYGASSSYSQIPPNSFPSYHFAPPAPVPQPAPIYYVDPATFRRDFSQRLATELTVNSRPIIQSLSMFAQDYVRFSEIIAHCLEAHIRRVPPWMKLPALYLLDMISKNIYDPYARHFAAFIIPLFIETYQQVDEPTRSKMVELVLTWRTGAPSGKELFGVPAQVSIERSIWGEGSSSVRSNRRTRRHKISSQRPQQSRFNSPGQVTKGQVLTELEFTLGQKERALQGNPADTLAHNHVAVLHQLKRLVEAGVSQDELVQILSQLRSLMRTATQPPPPPPQPQPQPVTAPSWPAPTTFTTPLPGIPSIAPIQAFSPIKTEASPSSDPPAVPPPVPAAGFADLLSSLLKSGVVSANGTPLGAGSTQAEEATDYERESSRSYRTSLLSHSIQLSTLGLTRSKPPIQSLLYDRLSLQCKQCAIRFPDTVSGKKELEDHLDMHFRQNLKANQNIGRGHSRSWFIGVEDWTHDVSDIKGKGRADHRPLNPKAAAAAEAVKRDTELRSQFVVVPPGDESKTISCPVCKEILSPEFVEDDEEWVWKNAVKKDDRIYHATCHAEASSNTLVARLRTDVSSRSRSGTPERVFQHKQQTPPRGLSSSPDSKLAGIKRKVDDNDRLSDSESTPRLKKMALAPS